LNSLPIPVIHDRKFESHIMRVIDLNRRYLFPTDRDGHNQTRARFPHGRKYASTRATPIVLFLPRTIAV
jgi:hypothetical protein